MAAGHKPAEHPSHHRSATRSRFDNYLNPATPPRIWPGRVLPGLAFFMVMEYFVLLINNLGLEEVYDTPSDNGEKENSAAPGVPSLRGKLHLTNEQYQEFQQQIEDGRKEWDRGI